MTANPRSELRGPECKVRRAPRKETVKVGQESKRVRAATLASLLVVAACGILLTSCTVVRNGSEVALPVITLSPTTASVQAGAPLQFSATVVSLFSTTITWAVNNIPGGNSTLGTITSSGLYMAPASVPNPATVTVKAISSAETYPYGSAIVTITPSAVNATVSVAPIDSSTMAGTTVQYTATVTGTANTAVTWSVNGVAGGNSTVGAISTSGLYTAPTAAPTPPTVVVTATSQADTSHSASTTLTLTASNSAPLFVNFGPNGNTGNPSTDYYNGLFTTVTVCLPGTQDCQIIPDVLVDTGSVGLRVLNSALTTVPADRAHDDQGLRRESGGGVRPIRRYLLRLGTGAVGRCGHRWRKGLLRSHSGDWRYHVHRAGNQLPEPGLRPQPRYRGGAGRQRHPGRGQFHSGLRPQLRGWPDLLRISLLRLPE